MSVNFSPHWGCGPVTSSNSIGSFSPAVRIDVTWPLSDIASSGMTYDFASASISSARLRSSPRFAIEVVHFSARSQISESFTEVIQGRPLAEPGYDPLSDPDPTATPIALRDGWTSGSSTGSEVQMGEIRNVEASVSVTLKLNAEKRPLRAAL